MDKRNDAKFFDFLLQCLSSFSVISFRIFFRTEDIERHEGGSHGIDGQKAGQIEVKSFSLSLFSFYGAIWSLISLSTEFADGPNCDWFIDIMCAWRLIALVLLAERSHELNHVLAPLDTFSFANFVLVLDGIFYCLPYRNHVVLPPRLDFITAKSPRDKPTTARKTFFSFSRTNKQFEGGKTEEVLINGINCSGAPVCIDWLKVKRRRTKKKRKEKRFGGCRVFLESTQSRHRRSSISAIPQDSIRNECEISWLESFLPLRILIRVLSLRRKPIYGGYPADSCGVSRKFDIQINCC